MRDRGPDPGRSQQRGLSEHERFSGASVLARSSGRRPNVGIGSDFDHGAGVAGFDSAADAPNVTAELLRRGYTEEQINAIWSGHFLRVLRAAEPACRS